MLEEKKSKHLFLGSKNISCVSWIADPRAYIEEKLLPMMAKG